MNHKKKRNIAFVLICAIFLGGIERLPVSAEETTSCNLKNPTIDSNGISTWDCVWFGNYWQDDTNGDGVADKNDEKTPIKWRVLSVDGDDAFLLADRNLDNRAYNDSLSFKKNIYWETCTVRSWLNGYSAEVNGNGKDFTNTCKVTWDMLTPTKNKYIYYRKDYDGQDLYYVFNESLDTIGMYFGGHRTDIDVRADEIAKQYGKYLPWLLY